MRINVEGEIKMESTDFVIEIILGYSVDPVCSPWCSGAEDEGRSQCQSVRAGDGLDWPLLAWKTEGSLKPRNEDGS